jgi:transposase
MDRKTVGRYIERGLEPPTYGPRPPQPRSTDPFLPYLRERLMAYPGLTAVRLWRELRERGYAGGYTAVKRTVREIRPQPIKPFEVRFETPPGEQAQVDLARFEAEFTDEPEVTRIVWLFSMVLGHSRLIWARFVVRQDLQTVLRCHIAALEAIGGMPREILYDRMKTAVIGEDADGLVVYNRSLVDLARHYGFQPKACRPYRAKTKGKVERPFRYIREDFFLAGSFRNLDDLNTQLRHWLDTVANARVHATTQRVVNEAFAEEKPHLKPLPLAPYRAVLKLERLSDTAATRRKLVPALYSQASGSKAAHGQPFQCGYAAVIHSGNPAFRRPSSSLARSSGRRNEAQSFTLETRSVGAICRMHITAFCASTRHPVNALPAAAIRSADR